MTKREKIRDAILGISDKKIESTNMCYRPTHVESGDTLEDKRRKQIVKWGDFGSDEIVVCAYGTGAFSSIKKGVVFTEDALWEKGVFDVAKKDSKYFNPLRYADISDVRWRSKKKSYFMVQLGDTEVEVYASIYAKFYAEALKQAVEAAGYTMEKKAEGPAEDKKPEKKKRSSKKTAEKPSEDDHHSVSEVDVESYDINARIAAIERELNILYDRRAELKAEEAARKAAEEATRKAAEEAAARKAAEEAAAQKAAEEAAKKKQKDDRDAEIAKFLEEIRAEHAANKTVVNKERYKQRKKPQGKPLTEKTFEELTAYELTQLIRMDEYKNISRSYAKPRSVDEKINMLEKEIILEFGNPLGGITGALLEQILVGQHKMDADHGTFYGMGGYLGRKYEELKAEGPTNHTRTQIERCVTVLNYILLSLQNTDRHLILSISVADSNCWNENRWNSWQKRLIRYYTEMRARFIRLYE